MLGNLGSQNEKYTKMSAQPGKDCLASVVTKRMRVFVSSISACGRGSCLRKQPQAENFTGESFCDPLLPA